MPSSAAWITSRGAAETTKNENRKPSRPSLRNRTVVPYPGRGVHDLVGIDNRRAGYRVTDHVLRLGARRVAFVGVEHAAATVEAREAGYREALYAWSSPVGREFVHRLDPADTAGVRRLMASGGPLTASTGGGEASILSAERRCSSSS